MSEPGGDIGDVLAFGAEASDLVFGADGERLPTAALVERGTSAFAGGGPPAVAAILTNDRPSVELVLGALVAGGRLVSLPLPGRGVDPTAYTTFLATACAQQGIDRVVARDDVAQMLTSAGVAATAHSELAGRAVGAPSSGGAQLVQFSSGSTGEPTPVELDGAALAANVGAILRRVEPRPGDVAVSWLPLSHDMGLVGMLLASVAASESWSSSERATVVLLETERFLRRPHMWLDALDTWAGTFTAAPDFGLRMSIRAPRASTLDLARLRVVICGGEIVRAPTLRAVAAELGPHGFSPLALCPSYGMAEIGLAASITPPSERWRSMRVDAAALGRGHLEVAGRSPAVEIVSSGPVLAGYDVVIDAPAGEFGSIGILAPAVGRDAWGEPFDSPAGRLETGDIGVRDDDGWLYVCGRTDDHIVAHGRKLHAPAIEDAAGRAAGVRAGRTTVVGLPSGEWGLVLEADATADPVAVRASARAAAVAVASVAPDEVLIVPRGTLPMTASGKVQRNEVRRRWLEGLFAEPDVQSG